MIMRRLIPNLLLFVLLSFLCIKPVFPEAQETSPDSSYLLEIFIPGYNFYREKNYVWGSIFLGLRFLSLYTSLYYHSRYVSYRSLERASKLADYFYGYGTVYYNPVEGGYFSSTGFSILAGRSLAYRDFSIAVHILLTGIGIYKGYRDSYEKFIEQSPEKKLLPEYSFYFFIHRDF